MCENFSGRKNDDIHGFVFINSISITVVLLHGTKRNHVILSSFDVFIDRKNLCQHINYVFAVCENSAWIIRIWYCDGFRHSVCTQNSNTNTALCWTKLYTCTHETIKQLWLKCLRKFNQHLKTLSISFNIPCSSCGNLSFRMKFHDIKLLKSVAADEENNFQMELLFVYNIFPLPDQMSYVIHSISVLNKWNEWGNSSRRGKKRNKEIQGNNVLKYKHSMFKFFFRFKIEFPIKLFLFSGWQNEFALCVANLF